MLIMLGEANKTFARSAIYRHLSAISLVKQISRRTKCAVKSVMVLALAVAHPKCKRTKCSDVNRIDTERYESAFLRHRGIDLGLAVAHPRFKKFLWCSGG